MAPNFAVIVRGREQRLAIAVERLVGQHELVTRPLPDDVAESSALSGGAVLSNGDIVLLADCDAMRLPAVFSGAGDREVASVVFLRDSLRLVHVWSTTGR